MREAICQPAPAQNRAVRAYRLYGLELESDWPLPCPEAPQDSEGHGPLGAGAGGRPALGRVELREGPASLFEPAAQRIASLPNPADWFHHLALEDGSSYVRWTNLFEFIVTRDGRSIFGRPLAEASQEAFQVYLLGQVLSFALLRQGLEPLHATVAVVDGAAAGFIGDTGYGKSSLGAAFLAAGYPLLTDDLLLTSRSGERFLAHPGPPRIKLYPEVARTLLGPRAEGVPLNRVTQKMVLPLDERQSHRAPAPLSALYVLNAPEKPPRRIGIRRLPPGRAFLELVKSTFNTILVEPQRLRRQFLHARQLVAAVPVKRLTYPRDLGQLGAVRDAVLADLRR